MAINGIDNSFDITYYSTNLTRSRGSLLNMAVVEDTNDPILVAMKV